MRWVPSKGIYCEERLNFEEVFFPRSFFQDDVVGASMNTYFFREGVLTMKQFYQGGVFSKEEFPPRRASTKGIYSKVKWQGFRCLNLSSLMIWCSGYFVRGGSLRVLPSR